MKKDTWYFKNKEHCKEYQRIYRKNSSHIFRAKDHAYRARKLKALPKWLTADMKKQMTRIYLYCRYTSIYHGSFYSVDHIIPLKGDNVCGLHVPWNLQIVPSDYNIKKGNKLDYNNSIDGYTVICESLVRDKVQYVAFSKKVIRLNDGKVFNSLSLACKDEGCNNSTMSQVCKGKRHSIHRNFYRYYDEVTNVEEEFNKAKIAYLSNKKTNKGVYCIQDKLRFNTVKEAANYYKVKDYKLREVINKRGNINEKQFEYCL